MYLDNWEEEVEKQRKRNDKLIEEFYDSLVSKGLTKKTIDKHTSNTDFYINHFLLNYDVLSAEEGVNEVSSFLGDFFIRKCMWSTKNSIKENAASIKKFYQFMLETNRITKKDNNMLKKEIKENMSRYLETVEKYNNPDEFGEDWLIDTFE